MAIHKASLDPAQTTSLESTFENANKTQKVDSRGWVVFFVDCRATAIALARNDRKGIAASGKWIATKILADFLAMTA
ncbi:hypothetical protein [Helicobacter zhangjianzhongii]|uniref:Uncharacterized protein n=1 Tax=Helicobacter zhangjianzhongii TaxID=2974574 RepID=A0ACC6FV05_9HELI|nr:MULTISPECIES: hypothetical protein [unclassified Helicobacter]MDL0080921.1 hypothetical protein [Helicobacter sp. CPD2-1]MDL0082955.1 hypothetical protein [Helicobacter sp. XJK30-2]